MLRKKFIFAPLLFAVALPLSAASGGTLVVHVDEPRSNASQAVGVPLPGATVRVSTDREMSSGRYGLREAVTDISGAAVLANLPPDDYWVEASLEGFLPRRWYMSVYSGLTHRAAVEISSTFPSCTLGELWDFRDLLIRRNLAPEDPSRSSVSCPMGPVK